MYLPIIIEPHHQLIVCVYLLKRQDPPNDDVKNFGRRPSPYIFHTYNMSILIFIRHETITSSSLKTGWEY